MTQKEIVMKCLGRGEGITQLKMSTYGITRLAHYIWLLRKEGMRIRSYWETDAVGKRYKIYFKAVAI